MLGEHEKGNDQKYSNSTENLSSLTSLTNAYFRCITQEFLFLFFFFALTGAQLSKYYNPLCTSCNTNPFANFSHCGVWGRFTSTSCGVECAWLGALPHLAPPTHTCTQPCFQAPEWDQDPVNFCQALSGCGAANGTMLNVFALMSTDCVVYKELVSGAVSICLSIIDSPFPPLFPILQRDQRRKNYTAHFSPGLHCIYSDML